MNIIGSLAYKYFGKKLGLDYIDADAMHKIRIICLHLSL